MRGGHLFEEYKGLLSFEIMYAQKMGYKNDMYRQISCGNRRSV